MSDVIVEVEGVSKRFGEVNAVDDFSFSVERGQVYGLLGPNGAGKSTILVALAALVSGLLLFGAHDVTVPGVGGILGGTHLSTGALALRALIATGYVAFGFSALLAIGTLFSTLTDTAASAIGASVGIYIVSGILDSISQLGQVRYAFPTHYFDAWETMFTDNTYSREMAIGIAVQLAYLVVIRAVAIMYFDRKDIRS